MYGGNIAALLRASNSAIGMLALAKVLRTRRKSAMLG
jgi:hypothetical protein